MAANNGYGESALPNRGGKLSGIYAQAALDTLFKGVPRSLPNQLLGRKPTYADLAAHMCKTARPADWDNIQEVITAGAEAKGEDSTAALKEFTTKCAELLGDKMWVGGSRKTRRLRKTRKNKRRATRYRRK
jgi:hypothetical protein